MAERALNLLLLLVALLSAFFAAQSLYLFLGVNSALPSWDMWNYLRDHYYPYLDGSYHFLDLFNKYNGHVVATTQIVLLVDGRLFHMAGIFPVAVSYASLLVIANLMAAMAVGTASRKDWAVATVILLGLTWSISQQANLILEFQVGWALAHLFAIVCILAAAIALEADHGADRRRWYALAFASDFLAVFSLASGVLVIVPLLAFPLLRRKTIQRPYAALILLHLCLAAVYLQPGGGPPHTAPFRDMALYLFLFLGNCLGGLLELRAAAGAVVLISLLGFAGWGAWTSLRRKDPLEFQEAVVLAIGIFVLCEAMITAYGRSFYGIEQAASTRYATASVIGVAALFVLVWRAYRGVSLRILLVGLFGAVLWASNAYQPYVLGWLHRVHAADDIAFALINGAFPVDRMKLAMNRSPESFRPEIRRAATLGLGSFSPSATRYRPPVNSLVWRDQKALVPCRSGLDGVSLTPNTLEVQGWAASPAKTGDNWILAYNGAGNLIGYARSSHARPDIALFYRDLGSNQVGFDLFLARERIGNSGLRLVVASSSDAPSACIYARKLPS